jgi:hypothetical protein
MKVIRLVKISEWTVSQWEGNIQSNKFLYARVKHDRLSIGVGASHLNAKTNSISFPYADIFLRRENWETPFPTKELLDYLNKFGFDCSKINHKKVDKEYKNGRI